MRRGVAGLLFFVAAIALALAGGGWYLQRVAFDTDRSGELARVVLRDDAVRTEITTATAQATAATLGLPVEEVQARVDAVARTSEGAALVHRVVSDAHATLIGERTAPVEITGTDLVQLTRNESVAGLPPVALPVREVTILAAMRDVLEWAVPIAAIVGAVALLLGLVAHPRKADAVFGIGAFCIIAGVVAFGLGYLVPVLLVPALTDDVWVSLIPAIARDALPLVLAISVILVACGLALMIGAAAARRRRAWSSPVSIRYGDQHRWS